MTRQREQITMKALPGMEEYAPPPRELYEDRERDLDISRKRDNREKARDVEIPPMVHPERRAWACGHDVPVDWYTFTYRDFVKTLSIDALTDIAKRWLRVYLPEFFYKPFDPLQCDYIREIVIRLVSGGFKAKAAPRGYGKSTLLIGMLLWATLNGVVRFCPMICESQDEAENRLKKIKFTLQTNDLLYEDYPEVCAPVRALKGVSQRAAGMTVNDEECYFEWLRDTIVLPRVRGSQCSTSAIMARGIEGGIRGICHMLITGEMLRPDVILIDDPSKQKAARSAALTKYIMDVIDADIGGTGGHGEKQAGFALVTIIKRGDAASQLTDRKMYPFWNGDVTAMMPKLPDNMEFWNEYEEILLRIINDSENEIKDIHSIPELNAYYLAHRAEMDAGCEVCSLYLHVSRELMAAAQLAQENGDPLLDEFGGDHESPEFLEALQRREKLPGAISSIQYAMNLYLKDPSVFDAEYNNNPRSYEKTPLLAITPYMVQSALSGIPRRIVPDDCERLFIGIDPGKEYLHFTAIAMPRYVRLGYIIDYGKYPLMHVEGDARSKDSEPYRALELAVYQGLCEISQFISEEQPYRYADGRPIALDLGCVDVRFMGAAVNRFCDEPKNRRRWLSMMGYHRKDSPRPSETCIVTDNMYARWNGSHWRHYQNSDAHKLFVHEGFRIPLGKPGSLSIFGSRMTDHREYAIGICAETYMEVAPNEYKWHVSDGVENHPLDTAALCYSAATRRGLRVIDEFVTGGASDAGTSRLSEDEQAALSEAQAELAEALQAAASAPAAPLPEPTPPAPRAPASEPVAVQYMDL